VVAYHDGETVIVYEDGTPIRGETGHPLRREDWSRLKHWLTLASGEAPIEDASEPRWTAKRLTGS
jgi:hypothetical protein